LKGNRKIFRSTQEEFKELPQAVEDKIKMYTV
jgi:hypothetical protein